MVNLTEFGRKLSKEAQEQALAIADLGNRIKAAAHELYPGIHWRMWTQGMWAKIYARAEEQWAEDQAKTVGG